MDAATQDELLALQTEVEEIDQQIMLLLGVRFRCTDQISAMAREQGLDAIDAPYQAEQLSSIQTMAMEAGVPSELAATILTAVLDVAAEHDRRLREQPYS